MYIKKEIFFKQYPNGFNSKYVKISEPFNDFYYITFNHLFDRLIKLFKIKKINNELIDFYNFYLENSESINKIFEDALTKDLTKNINKQIIEDLKKLNTNNISFYI